MLKSVAHNPATSPISWRIVSDYSQPPPPPAFDDATQSWIDDLLKAYR